MTLEQLKNDLESNNMTSEMLIFTLTDNDFVARQYIDTMSTICSREIEYLSDIEHLCQPSFSIFGEDLHASNTLRVYCVDEFDCTYEPLLMETYFIVVTKKVSKEANEIFKNNIITFPKLVDWQIKDYVYSMAEGVPTKDLDWLIDLYGKDIYRLDQEISKFKIFSVSERQYLFSDLKLEGAYTDASEYNIFNLVNALTSKDIGSIKSIYSELDRVDINEFGLLTLLLKNFKNIMMVQTQINPTAETSLMESKQFYAIKRLPKVYTGEQLVKIFCFLSDIDRQVKSGELPTEIMINYMIVKILSM